MRKNHTRAYPVIILLSAMFPFLGFWQMNLLNILGEFLFQKNIYHSLYVNYLSASYLLADAVALIPIGIMLDKITLKKAMLTGIAIFSFGGLVFAASNSFYLMLLGRVISGIGHAFALMGCFRLINIIAPKDRQASWINL